MQAGHCAFRAWCRAPHIVGPMAGHCAMSARPTQRRTGSAQVEAVPFSIGIGSVPDPRPAKSRLRRECALPGCVLFGPFLR